MPASRTRADPMDDLGSSLPEGYLTVGSDAEEVNDDVIETLPGLVFLLGRVLLGASVPLPPRLWTRC